MFFIFKLELKIIILIRFYVNRINNFSMDCSRQIKLFNSSFFFISLFDDINNCSIDKRKNNTSLNYAFIASASVEGLFFILKLLILNFYFLLYKEFILIIKSIFKFFYRFCCFRKNNLQICCRKTCKLGRNTYSYFKRLYTYNFYFYKNIFVEIIINVSFIIHEFLILYASISISLNCKCLFFPLFWSFLFSFVIQILNSVFYITTNIWISFGTFILLIVPLSLYYTQADVNEYIFSLIYHSFLLILNVWSLCKIFKYDNKEDTLKTILKEREKKEGYPLNIELNRTIQNKLYQNNTIKNIYSSFSNNNNYCIKSRYSLKYILIVCFLMMIIAKGIIIVFDIFSLNSSEKQLWLIYPLFGDICLVNFVAWISFTKIEINKIMLI